MSGLYEAVEEIASNMSEDPSLKMWVMMLRTALKASGKDEEKKLDQDYVEMRTAMASPEVYNRRMIDKFKTKPAPEGEKINKLEEWMGGMAQCLDGPCKDEYVAIHAGMPLDAFCKVGPLETVYQLKKEGLYQWIKKEEQKKIIAG